jgi:sugar lactone lactonase YvrE
VVSPLDAHDQVRMNEQFTFCVRVACRSIARALFVGLLLLLARSAPGEILFESDYGSGTINCFAPGAAPSPFATGFAPTGLAFDNAGNLFAGDGGGGGWNEGRILRFTPDGSSTVFASGLWAPSGLAFNKQGVLFADDYNNNIYQYTPQGVQTIFASGLSGPGGLAFDASGDLFVAEWNTGNIDRLTPGGVRSTFASGFTRPCGLAFDSAGDLFVVDCGTPVFRDGSVYKVTPGGITTMIASGMFGPTSLAFDTAGNLYVTDTWNGRMLEFSPDGTESTFASDLNLPTFLAFQPIPEPSGVILLLVGNSTLFLLRRTHHGQKVCARTSNARPKVR